MITLAMESAERHGRPTCSECNDMLRRKRGCKKPGFDLPQSGSPFVYSSPILQSPEDRVLRECPTGKILREAPEIYSIIESARMVEALTPDGFHRQPRYMQHAIRITSSESARLRELNRLEKTGFGDSAYGSRVRNG